MVTRRNVCYVVDFVQTQTVQQRKIKSLWKIISIADNEKLQIRNGISKQPKN